jgi:hypothetical protein
MTCPQPTARRSELIRSELSIMEPTPPNPARPSASTWNPLLLLWILLAGLLAWGYLQFRQPYFTVPEQYHIRSLGESQERWTAFHAQQQRVDRLNAPLDFAVLGGLLSLAFAMTRSACCSLPVRVCAAVPVGMLLGGAAGFLGCIAHQTLTPYEMYPTVADTVKVQSILLGLFGAGVGSAAGLFHRPPKTVLQCAVAGLVAGILAGMMFPLIASFVLPAANVQPLIPPQPVPQLLWLGFSCILLGLIVPLGADPASGQSALSARERAASESPAAHDLAAHDSAAKSPTPEDAAGDGNDS